MNGPARGRLVGVAFIAWLAMVGFDFFLHAGLLADLYTRPSPFLLPLEQAFARIPLGYLSFLILAFLLVWLMDRTGTLGWRAGLRFGLVLGAAAWGALALGLYSIATAEPDLLAAWTLGQTVELGLAEAVAGHGIEGAGLRRLFLRTLGFVLLAVLAGIAWQNLL